MKRSAPLMPILALAFVFALPSAPGAGSMFGPGAAFAQGGLLQCMEQCIRYEGGNSAANKTTCKSRCANVPMRGAGQGGAPDCMGRFKDCRGACGKNKTCKRACSKRLLTCK